MDKKLKVLMVMASPFRSGVAPENYIRAKAVYDSTNTEVDIVCFPIGEDIQETNVRIIRVPKNKIFRSYQVGEYKKILVYSSLMFFKLLFKRDKKYDFIFLYNAGYIFFWLLRPFYKGKIIPVIYNTLENESLKWNISKNKTIISIISKSESFIFRYYDALIFNNIRLLEVFKKRNVPENKMHLIPFAYDINFNAESNLTSYSNTNQPFKILYAGSFVRIQNVDLIYSIASNLINYNVEFNLVGATDTELIAERKKILQLRNVKIFKRLNQTDLKNFYKEANLLISCRVEGGNDLPFKIIEYMSWGKGILATDLPIHNLFLNKKIACLVEPDSLIMAAQILKLMENPNIINQYEKNVRKYFQENHSFDVMKEKYLDLIKGLNKENNAKKCLEDTLKYLQ